MKWLKKSLMLASLISILLFPRILRAGGIVGKIYDAHNGTSSGGTAVSCWINDGSSGTQNVNCTPWGDWGVASGNFSPSAQPGDTAKMSGSLTVGPKTYAVHARNRMLSTSVFLPTAFLDDPDKNVRANSFGIWYVTDVSDANDTLHAEGWLKKNPNQKITFYNYFWENGNYVDTSASHSQVYLNLEKQDSIWTPEDSAVVRLWKTIGDTTWESDTTFALDTLKYGGATMLEEIIFPERKIINDTILPYINNVTEWPDTALLDKYPIKAWISDASGINSDSTFLHWWKQGQETFKTVADSVKADTFYFTGDAGGVSLGDTICYRIEAIDDSDNKNKAFWPGQNEWYSFKVKSIGTEEGQLGKKEAKIGPNPFYSNVNISWPVKKARLNIYDVSGRLIDKVQVDNYKAKWGKEASKGIYFAKPCELNGKIEVKNSVWKLIKL